MARRPVIVGLSCERLDDNMRAFVSANDAALAFARWYMRTIYVPQSDVHIANSPYTAEELTTGRRPVYVAPMGVDVDTFTHTRRNAARRADINASVGAGERPCLLLYAGRLSAEKNVDMLIDTVARLSERDRYRLLIVGDGPRRSLLEARAAAECPGVVHVRSTIADRAALADLMANVDIFVHPNPREPFGIAPLEAMASGVPVVLPDRGGVLAYANPDNAWMAPALPGSFAAAIENVSRYPGLRDERVARARATAEGHRWSNAASAFFRIYDEISRAHRADVVTSVLEEAV